MRYKKSRMNRHNLVRSVSSRFIRKDGALMAVGIRLFALCICGVIIFSALKIQNAFKEYKSNDSVRIYMDILMLIRIKRHYL